MENIYLESVEQAMEVIRSTDHVRAVGNRSKPLLSNFSEPITSLDCRGLSGILEYQPTEFTFTALSGTSLKTIAENLAAHGQYLPFDPPFSEQGSTLGGAISSGLNGSSSLRFGGIRDFVLGIRFIDGQGNFVTAGGKVVKNSAGFDLPKFMVGSLGQFGLMTEVTLKVFPRPAFQATLEFEGDFATQVQRIRKLILTPLEIDAVDIQSSALTVRIGGSKQTLNSAKQRIEDLWNVSADRYFTDEDDQEYWKIVNGFGWHTEEKCTLVKVPCQLTDVECLAGLATDTGSEFRVSIAGQVFYFSTPADKFSLLQSRLAARSLKALPFAGHFPTIPDGSFVVPDRGTLWHSMKRALDPQNRFRVGWI